MNLSKQDRNTAFTIAIVLVICTVSLVAIGASIWQAVAPGVNTILSYVGIKARAATIDYNFTVPQKETVASSSTASFSTSSSSTTQEQSSSTPTTSALSSVSASASSSSSSTAPGLVAGTIDYNFPVPRLTEAELSNVAITGLEDAILDDARLAGLGSGSDRAVINLRVQIPKIKVDSPVIQGLGSTDLLHQGFWTYPSSYGIGQGELILLCHRRYFGPNDPRSCWHLDKVSKGDKITLVGEKNKKINYKVIGVNVFDGGDPTVYQTSSDDNYLKIVTCTPLGSSAQRLVLLAQRV